MANDVCATLANNLQTTLNNVNKRLLLAKIFVFMMVGTQFALVMASNYQDSMKSILLILTPILLVSTLIFGYFTLNLCSWRELLYFSIGQCQQLIRDGLILNNGLPLSLNKEYNTIVDSQIKFIKSRIWPIDETTYVKHFSNV